jgi:hypothetical protein
LVYCWCIGSHLAEAGRRGHFLKEGGVADRMELPAYEHSGFERSLPLSEIGSGSHKVSIVVVTDDGRTYRRADRHIDFRVGSKRY